MFFSAKDFHIFANSDEGRGDYLLQEIKLSAGVDIHSTMSLKQARAILKRAKEAICSRDRFLLDVFRAHKWLRPWKVVPRLRNFSPPAGDYGIGVEVEMGFTSRENAVWVANKIKEWKNITIDTEGGEHPLEVTFPPVLYSKFNARSQVCRYLKLLNNNSDKVYEHEWDDEVGIHVNVSKGGMDYLFYSTYTTLERRLHDIEYVLISLSQDARNKYFGRNPYGYGYISDDRSYIEWKLFDSTTDHKKLRKYVHVAVALTDLAFGSARITNDSVTAAMEAALKKR